MHRPFGPLFWLTLAAIALALGATFSFGWCAASAYWSFFVGRRP